MLFLKEHKYGVVGATIFTIVMLTLLLLLGFTTPLPLPEERGILIDFGGGGSVNAGASSSTASHTKNTSTPSPSNSGYNTQNIEDAPSFKPSEVPNDNVIETPVNTETITTSSEPAVTTPTNQLNNRLSNLNIGSSLSGGSGTGTAGTGTGGGNPGIGNGVDGSGRGPGGIGGNLAGRKQIKKVEPNRKENMFGKVELQITVDEKGNVTDIIVISTNCNECVQPAKDAVKQWKYESKPNSGYQTGKVIIEFKQT